MTTFVRTNIFITRQERVALQKIARRRKVSASAVLREFVDKGLGLPTVITEYSHPSAAFQPKK